MPELAIVYCEECNPQQLHQKDRRQYKQNSTSAKIYQFPEKERRSQEDRRKVQDRRVGKEAPAKQLGQRKTKGRRPFDGHSWFMGTVDDAISEQWSLVAEQKTICPRCNKKAVR